MRIATYNVEWFDSLFGSDGRVLLDGEWSARHNVTRTAQLEALRDVFLAMDADGIMIVEAPDTNRKRDTVRALTQFADWAGLRTQAVEMGYINDTQQEIAFLYDPRVITAHHEPIGFPAGTHEPELVSFNSEKQVWLSAQDPEMAQFSKPPLELELRHLQSDAIVRLIGVHVKSKAPHGATSKAEIKRVSIENRRKQLSQSVWLRERIEMHLRAGEPLIVLGDFNDGPGMDEFEQLHGRSGLDVIMGYEMEVDPSLRLYDPHVLTERTTARFFRKETKQYFGVLLDYIMVSQDLRAGSRWRIWHPFEDPQIAVDEPLREALLAASDHFPVTLDLSVS